ncbi:MAG: peptide deformylase [Saprospiraceae bacterium]|nr:peptide deformylase [Saprospiraceae bacterium]
MILPIYAYGQPVLRKKAVEINPDFAGLQDLISNMWETMYHAQGVGLAAPQVGHSIRLFIIDTEQIKKDENMPIGYKKVFINATILEQEGDLWAYEEGCLSIPKIRGDVERKPRIVIEYLDELFQKHTDSFDGINARVIQHEYDHIEGILFTDHLKPIKKTLIHRRLENIKHGKVDADYRLRFAKFR